MRTMKYSWTDMDKENPKYLEENRSHCHIIDDKSHTDSPEIEAGLSWLQSHRLAT
jgi:hypothetical protein